jgi:NADPH:quinone reductase-like Zn-dependent oxidoreductase
MTMAAAGFRRYGGPEVLEVMRVAMPAAGAGQVLVKVEASSVNGGEIAQRRGKLRALARVSLPRYVGIDFAGEILALGPGVTEFSIGDRVWGTVDERGSVGAAAEAVAIDTGRVSRMPEGWSAADAVSVLAGAATAVVGLRDKARLRAGERLLVRGASGGVGSVAVQLGRMYGAHVTALSSQSSEQFVRGLGADEVIDYRTSLDAIGTYDVVFDTRGTDLWRLRQHLAPRGRMVAVSFDVDRKVRSLGGIAASSIFGGRRIRFFLGHPTAALIGEVARLAEDGHLQPIVDEVYPLDRIGDAHARLEAGGVHGKVVLVVEETASGAVD